MPIDSSILLGIKRPPTLSEQYAQQQELQSRDQERQLRAQEIQLRGTALAEKQRDQQEEDAIRRVLTENNGDVKAALPKIMQVAPKQGIAWQKAIADSEKSQMDVREKAYQIQKLSLEHDALKTAHIAQAYQAVGTQADWERVTLALKANDYDVSDVPPDYSPQAKDIIVKKALSIKDAIEAENKRLDNERATNEQIARDKDRTADNARLDAAAIETARNHRAMEATALIRARRPAAGGAGGEKLTPDAVSKIATAYNLLGIPAIPTRLSDAEKIPILNEAAKQDKAVGRTPAQAVTRQLTTKADAGALVTLGKLSSSAEAFESKALGQVDLITGLSQKVSRTKWPIVNGMIQSGRERIIGDEDATKLANAISTFSAEYAKIMEGSTGSVAGSSDSSRKAAERLINTSMSKGTMAGVLDLMKQEMRLTIQGYDTAKEHITTRISGTPQSQPQQMAPKYRFNPATGKIEPYQ